ncbi:acyltransferase [Fulvivirga ligni]|uniref:acyltransferase n=1 Tax=Fulvivirga ligni TaxID=2904246 RepID=UPI001F192F39|nr:hypothetical protein [Fulvivirga ligni]UII22664.1 hypothetical protein LVD16_05420 [Fulvivirga ligni]
MIFYNILSKGKIKKSATIGLNVRILDIRNVEIGVRTNINYDSIIDGRGSGVQIGNDVDVAPQVNIWSLEHDPKSDIHSSRSEKVVIKDNVWLANKVIILPGSYIESGVVIGAGGVFKGRALRNGIYVGNPATVKKSRPQDPTFKLTAIRRFR